jgi:GntR family transcriptional regulator
VEGLAEFQPLYAQVKDLLVQRIISGSWLPGGMLPNEFQLAAEYRVSQGTVRKALLSMEADQLIVRLQGKGTYVAEHTRQRALYHFFRIVGLDGSQLIPTSYVLERKMQRATKPQAKQLSIAPGSSLHAIKRLRDFVGEPVIFERIFVPVEFMPTLSVPLGVQRDEEMYVIYQQQFNIMIVRATERLAAAAATSEEAKLLRLKPGAPLIEITRLARDVSGRTVELRVSRLETSNCRYAAEVY